VAERWIVDSSPLISLGKIGRLDLLPSLAAEVVIPEAVAAEVRRVSDEASAFLAAASLAVRSVDAHPLVTPWGLGAGETAVLSLAQESEGVAVLDDRAARRCASALGIPSRGTVGVVLLAKSRGLVPSARSLLEALRQAGLHLSPDLFAVALDLAGESGGEGL
jgi:predicted nucleic acid-binding protein